MRHTWTISTIDGTNETPTVGEYITSTSGDFINRGVVIGVSVLTNKTTGAYGTVSARTATTVTATGISFDPGDFYSVTLPTPWTVQNEFGPLIEIECNICGFSYPVKELVKGRCKDCIDKPQKSKS